MKKQFLIVALALILLLLQAVTVWALPSAPTIGDGQYTDWNDAVCVTDSGGADDETSPVRADITDYCIHMDSNYLYILMALDDTGYQGGNASTVGVRLDLTGDDVFDYIVLAEFEQNPATLDRYSIGTCSATGSCQNEDDVCLADLLTPCSNEVSGTTYTSLVGVGTDYPDPFAGRTSPGCAGTNCGSLDGYIELAIPWQIFPVPTQTGVFYDNVPSPNSAGEYGSFPSGPAQAPKDVADPRIVCDADAVCTPEFPNAVSFKAAGSAVDPAAGTMPLLLTGTMLLLTGWVLNERRQEKERLAMAARQAHPQYTDRR